MVFPYTTEQARGTLDSNRRTALTALMSTIRGGPPTLTSATGRTPGRAPGAASKSPVAEGVGWQAASANPATKSPLPMIDAILGLATIYALRATMSV